MAVNFYMRVMNGNTACHKAFSLCFINADGVMGNGRTHALQATQADVIAISETHLSLEHQRCIQRSFGQYECFWGAPVDGKSGGGGFLVRRGSCWHVKLLDFPVGSACHKHVSCGRLAVLSLWLGKGSRQMLVYNMYGYSGARWSLKLKHWTHRLIEDAMGDAAMRGLPAVLGGDANLEVDDSQLLHGMPQMGWVHVPAMCGLASVHTRFKGKGSCIDHVFLNSLAASSFHDFSIGDRTGFADHCPLFCSLAIDVCSQTVLRNRSYAQVQMGQSHVPLRDPVEALGNKFDLDLKTGAVDDAYRMWSRYAEKHLEALWSQHQSADRFQHGRGSVRLTSQDLWPPSCRDSAASLKCRRLWSTACRMVELEKRPFEHKAACTWHNAREALPYLSGDVAQTVQSILDGPCSVENARMVKQHLDSFLVSVQNEEKRARIQAWKRSLQSSTRSQHRWLRQDSMSSTRLCFTGPDGKLTANVNKQFEAVRTAWRAVTDLFKNGEPDSDAFFHEYGQLLNPVEVDLPPLTADMLRTELANMTPSSPGLDNWCHRDLLLLSTHAPWVFNELCRLFQAIESHGKWPDSAIAGFTTLIPKGDAAPANSGELRPITVLSLLYRLYARIRAKPEGMWGGRTSRGAEPLLLDVALDLESSGPHQLVAGLSFDLSKAFDRVPRELLGDILRRMRMPGCVLRPYLYMLRHATRRYKLGVCFDRAQRLHGGILQGCPLSMLSMNCIVNIWLRMLHSRIPACRPRSYVDDVSATVIQPNEQSLIADLQSVEHESSSFVASFGGRMNTDKCFTFGHRGVRGMVHAAIEHLDEFRLVGGSFVYRPIEQDSPTKLEVKRLQKWMRVVVHARHLPVSFRDRRGCLLRTRSQFTWGTGTHQLATNKKSRGGSQQTSFCDSSVSPAARSLSGQPCIVLLALGFAFVEPTFLQSGRRPPVGVARDVVDFTDSSLSRAFPLAECHG